MLCVLREPTKGSMFKLYPESLPLAKTRAFQGLSDKTLRGSPLGGYGASLPFGDFITEEWSLCLGWFKRRTSVAEL